MTGCDLFMLYVLTTVMFLRCLVCPGARLGAAVHDALHRASRCGALVLRRRRGPPV